MLKTALEACGASPAGRLLQPYALPSASLAFPCAPHPPPLQAPINRSRDRNATEKEKELGATRSA